MQCDVAGVVSKVSVGGGKRNRCGRLRRDGSCGGGIGGGVEVVRGEVAASRRLYTQEGLPIVLPFFWGVGVGSKNAIVV